MSFVSKKEKYTFRIILIIIYVSQIEKQSVTPKNTQICRRETFHRQTFEASPKYLNQRNKLFYLKVKIEPLWIIKVGVSIVCQCLCVYQLLFSPKDILEQRAECQTAEAQLFLFFTKECTPSSCEVFPLLFEQHETSKRFEKCNKTSVNPWDVIWHNLLHILMSISCKPN